jgi:two-component system, LytTR family, response regulator
MPETKPVQCLIVDDEPPAREVIKRYIAEMPMLQLAGECANAIQAMSFLQQQTVDLIFLDIHLPQLKGNELLKILKNPPKVIFTTAHADYALEGYELDVIDYLLKPIPFDRFFKAVHKALQTQGAAPDTYLQAPSASKQDAFVYFRVDRKMVKVMLHDILYIESMKDYAKVVTDGGTLVTKQSMQALEAMLPDRQFIRTHRSFIVSLPKVKSFTHEIIEIGKTEIPIGKLFRNGVLKVLG